MPNGNATDDGGPSGGPSKLLSMLLIFGTAGRFLPVTHSPNRTADAHDLQSDCRLAPQKPVSSWS